MRLFVDVPDDAMSPRFDKYDSVSVMSNCMPDNGEYALAAVTDRESGKTDLVLRTFHYDNDTITLTPINRRYPSMVFRGEDLQLVSILGRAYGVRYARSGRYKSWFATAKKAERTVSADEKG